MFSSISYCDKYTKSTSQEKLGSGEQSLTIGNLSCTMKTVSTKNKGVRQNASQTLVREIVPSP